MALKFCLDISVRCRVRIHNLFRDDCSNRMDTHALPFYRLDTNVAKLSVPQYIKAPATFGDKIRKRRLELKMLQKDVAQMIGVTEDSVTFWENNRAFPSIKHMPKIIDFFGLLPF